MEPQIRYVQSADGTRIATCSLGEGQPLVHHGFWFTTIDLAWRIPEALANLERLAQKRRVVLYDSRGAGLSSRHATDFSLEARVCDLEAVVASLGADQVDLFAAGRAAPEAIAFAARQPEKTNKLALWSPVARGADYRVVDERMRLLEPLAEADWEFYIQCRALVLFGWNDVGRLLAKMQAKEVSREVHLKHVEAGDHDDVSALLPLVRCPTLVMIRREMDLVDQAPSQEVAAAIPRARLVMFHQEQLMLLAGDWDSSLRIVADFLDEDLPPALDEPLPSATAVILFTDIADSAALTERMGDAAFRETARALDDRLRSAIRDAGGRPVDGRLLGDGLMATFPSAREAIRAAVRCNDVSGESELRLRIGLHAGDVIREEGNVFGGAVNIASRIADAAAPGEVLVSQTVRDLARTSAGVAFEDRGEHELKGIEDPVRLYEVRWQVEEPSP